MKKFAKPIPFALVVFSLASVGVWFSSAQSQTGAPTVTVPSPKPPEKAAQDLQAKIPLDTTKIGDPLPRNLFIELSKLINPTVVSITTSTTPKQRGNARRYRDPMEEFFEEFWGGRGQPQPQRQRPMQALGTGFIIRDTGLIITNNHVVESADVIKVQLDNTSDKFYEAEVIGRDSRTDIALIKIDAKRPLPYARLGSSKDVQVGEWVAAFGNPYGHAHTMTKGIISAIGREIAELNRFPFIQTDASINPGNSGGPLVNTQGLVIGVNTAIDARAQGIGFAIPIDNVKQVVASLEKEGRVRRGMIGVAIDGISEAVAAQIGLEEPTGALVTDVPRGGPAAKAGIQTYDIIVEVNGKKINGPAELQNVIAEQAIGSNVKIKTWRFDDRGKRHDKTFTVAIVESPDDRKSAAKPAKTYFGQKAPFELGFKVADWSESLAEEFEIPSAEVKNPIITEVERGGPAAVAGFRPGDMILDVNRQAVPKATEVLRALKKGRNIIRLMRGNMIVIVTLGS